MLVKHREDLTQVHAIIILEQTAACALISNVQLQVVDSWIASLECFEHRPVLAALFAKYIDTTVDYCRRNFKTVVPLPLVNQVQTVCKVMEGFLPQVRPRMLPLPVVGRNIGQRVGWYMLFHDGLANSFRPCALAALSTAVA